MNKTDLDKLTGLFSKQLNIVITSHFNPDGDAVGSVMAVYHILKQMNHHVTIAFPNHFPSFLGWIKDSENSLFYDRNKTEIEKALKTADIIFCLDYNALNRLGEMEVPLQKAVGIKILIDHHPNPEIERFQYVLHDTSVSSTAELVYDFLQMLQFNDRINQAAAESLYAGIITDTGSLSFNCNQSRTYRIVADLVDRGVHAERLHRLIYDNFSEKRMRLLAYALHQKMEIIVGQRTALIPLTLDELEQFDFQQGDTEGIVNFPLSIRTINLSILLTQRKDRIRISFRSKGDFPANEIATKYFIGGGHRNAAGGDSFVPMEETIRKIKEILPLYFSQLDFDVK
ncbi:MAG: bifunctional oligoribonuclease/PAP phosphatase NrnA [Bacteroidales bacterium]|nr:bifunctional oligoribonuclease/PAP phosphatase NrnA [Bacteroidales bacterium]